MKSLCIKTNNSDLLQYLLNELNDLELEEVYFSCNKFKHYKNIIIHYTGKDNHLFLNKISSILSLLVVDELEEDFLKRILLQNYFYFDNRERNQILNLCFDITANDFSVIFDKKFKVLIRKDNVISMNSRFSNIITKLGIEGNVFVDEGTDVITFYNNRYDKKKLEYEQEKFISYLDTFFAWIYMV